MAAAREGINATRAGTAPAANSAFAASMAASEEETDQELPAQTPPDSASLTAPTEPGSPTDVPVPLPRPKGPKTITSSQLQKLQRSQVAQLKKAGVKLTPKKGNTYVYNQSRSRTKNYELTGSGKTKSIYSGSLYAIGSLPKSSSSPKLKNTFLYHKGASGVIASLRKKGISVYIDTSLEATSSRAYMRKGRFIGIRPDTTWADVLSIEKQFVR